MAKPTIPEFLKVNDDQSITVTLSRPFDVNGAKLSSLTLREPRLSDQLAMQNHSDKSAEQEVFMVSSLAEVAASDLARLPLKDYRRLSMGLALFIV